MERLTAEVPYEMAGMRLDQVLAELFDDYSRTKLQTWLKMGKVKVNGKDLKAKEKLEGGETIVLDAEPEIVVDSEAEAIPLDIVYDWPGPARVSVHIGPPIAPPGAGDRDAVERFLQRIRAGLEALAAEETT